MTENPTEPLPTLRPDDVVFVKPKARRKHRGIVALVVVVVVLALLVVAFFVAENFARSYATNYVREKVASAVGLKSTAPVHVDLGTGSIILQLIGGKLDAARVEVKPLTFQGVTGSASVVARGIPLDSDQPVRSMDLAVTVPSSSIQSQLEKSAPQLKQLGAKFTVSGQHIVVAMKIRLFALSVPLSATVTPGVKNGGPTFSLDSVAIAGQSTSAGALEKVFPGFLATLNSGKSICIANLLPSEFRLTRVSLHDKSLTYGFSGDGAKLNSAAFEKKGTCPKG